MVHFSPQTENTSQSKNERDFGFEGNTGHPKHCNGCRGQSWFLVFHIVDSLALFYALVDDFNDRFSRFSALICALRAFFSSKVSSDARA